MIETVNLRPRILAQPSSRKEIGESEVEEKPEAKVATEDIVEENKNKPNTEFFWFNSELRKKYIGQLSFPAYVVSSIFHLITGLVLGFTKVNPATKSLLANAATSFTKVVNSAVYGDLALGALKKRNSFDFLSRILEPILNLLSQLSNYHLLRGLSSAMTQLHLVNYPHITQKGNLWANFIENIQLSKKFFVEAWTSSFFGPNRKLFKGSKDEGHTLAFASHIQGISSIIGLLNGSRRNLIDKIVGTIRNFIGVVVDIDLMFRKDPDERKTGIFYFIHAILDTFKRFIPKEKADCLDNLIMPVYNAAIYHFGKITKKQIEGTYQHSVPLVQAA